MSRTRNRSRWGRWWRRGLAVAGLAVCGFAGYSAATWPDVAALRRRNPDDTAFLKRYRAKSKAEKLPALRWSWVSYAEISPHLMQAVLVAEDIDFFSHRGFAWSELQVSVKEALQDGAPLRGASTLTQQLAKNLYLSSSRNPLRKVEEAILTWQLERELEKRRLLELYLNVVELGRGIYGVEAAAREYFGKPASELAVEESAALAASLSRPASWHPGVDSTAYQKRVALVRRRMEKAQWILGLL